MANKKIQVTVYLDETDYRDYAHKADAISKTMSGGARVYTADLVRFAMKKSKPAVLELTSKHF